MTKKHVSGRYSANISYKIHFISGENFLVALDTYTKKMYPPSIVFEGVGAGS